MVCASFRKVPGAGGAIFTGGAYGGRVLADRLGHALSDARGLVLVAHHSNLGNPPPSATLDVLAGIEAGAVAPPTDQLRQTMLGDLQRWQLRAVIVGPMAHHAVMVAFFTALLRRPPSERDGVYVFADVTP